MVEHSFRKAEVEGSTPSIGCMGSRLLNIKEFSIVKNFLEKNFYWCIFCGFVLQFFGASYRMWDSALKIIFALIYLTGTAILVLGFYFYVKSKHRHSIWCLFALFPILGWIVLILLKDKSPLPLSKENS